MSNKGLDIYRHSHYYVTAELALSIFAFWPSYFSVLHKAPLGFHIHGIASTIWMMLLIGQGWSASVRRYALHRKFGLASIYIFPFFFAGMAAVAISMSKKTGAGDSFYMIYGARFAVIDGLAAICVAWLFYQGVRNRRNPALHSRYFLATLLLLLGPITGRTVEHLFLHINGPQDFWLDAWCVRVANIISITISLWLYFDNRRLGKPFLGVLVTVIAQMICWEIIGSAASFSPLFYDLGRMPLLYSLGAVVVIGIAIVQFSLKRSILQGRSIAVPQ